MSKTDSRFVVYEGNIDKADQSAEIRHVGLNEDEVLVLNGEAVEITEDQFNLLSQRVRLRTLEDEDAKEAQKVKDAEEAAAQEGVYDPGEHDVKDVQSYLDSVTPEEQDRVKAAESAGKARTSIIDHQPNEG